MRVKFFLDPVSGWTCWIPQGPAEADPQADKDRPAAPQRPAGQSLAVHVLGRVGAWVGVYEQGPSGAWRRVHIARMAGVVVGLLAVVSCVLGVSLGPTTTTLVLKGSQPQSYIPECRGDLYRNKAQASPTTLPGDIVCANRLSAPEGYRAWVLLYWVRQANGQFVQASATIRVNIAPTPPGGRPILSWANGTQESITDGCAPSHKLPIESWWRWPWFYGPLMRGFLNDGFTVVATDYIGLGTPGGHPYLVGKSEGAAVLAAARAAQNFSPAQASGPIIIAGHSQGGHAALFADWQAEHIDYFAPGADVRGVIALAPPTFLDRIASLLLANPSSNSDGVRNLLIAAGSWHRLYKLKYPKVLTDAGQAEANRASDPTEGGCYQLSASNPGLLVRSGALPLEWTDWLGIHTVPVGRLPDTIPLLVVQGTDDKQVPYPATLAAVRDICESGVPVQFGVIQEGDHGAPVRGQSAERLIRPWVQRRIGGYVETNCASLPPSAQLRMYTVSAGDALSGIADRFHVAGGWRTLYHCNRDIITNPDLIYPGQRLFIC